MSNDWLRVGADSAGLSTEILLGIGLGLLVAGAGLGWLFRVGWKAAEYRFALMVSEMVARIIAERASGDALPPEVQRNVAEAALMKLPKLRDTIAQAQREEQRLAEMLIHVAAGGRLDDPPSQWRKLRKD